MFQKLSILAFVAVAGVLAVTVPEVPHATVRLEGKVEASSNSLLTCFFDATYPKDGQGMTSYQWSPEIAFWFNSVLLGEYRGKYNIIFLIIFITSDIFKIFNYRYWNDFRPPLPH